MSYAAGIYRGARAFSARHGHASSFGRSPEYRCWRHINIRCYNKNSKSFPRYGGRGIRVCRRWRASFESFLADMGPKPSPRHSIERKNNDGDYTPRNCLWATPTEQSRNRRTTKLTPARVRRIRAALGRGEKQRAIAARFGVCPSTVTHINTGRQWRDA